jgi:hypothetical protein
VGVEFGSHRAVGEDGAGLGLVLARSETLFEGTAKEEEAAGRIGKS